MGEVMRASVPLVMYRSQGKYALAEKLIQDIVAIRGALKEVEGDKE